MELDGLRSPLYAGSRTGPFVGLGTTLDVANQMSRSASGVDLDLSQVKETL